MHLILSRSVSRLRFSNFMRLHISLLFYLFRNSLFDLNVYNVYYVVPEIAASSGMIVRLAPRIPPGLCFCQVTDRGNRKYVCCISCNIDCIYLYIKKSYKKYAKPNVFTGVSHISFSQQKKRITGIEPAYPAWEAGVLPMNYIRMNYIIL